MDEVEKWAGNAERNHHVCDPSMHAQVAWPMLDVVVALATCSLGRRYTGDQHGHLNAHHADVLLEQGI